MKSVAHYQDYHKPHAYINTHIHTKDGHSLKQQRDGAGGGQRRGGGEVKQGEVTNPQHCMPCPLPLNSCYWGLGEKF